MRFVFRVDSYANSGAGHVMRTSALAEELIAKQYEVIFIGSTKEIPWVQEYISSLGFDQILDNSDFFNSDSKNDVLILDSYTLPLSDTFIAPNKWFKIIAFIDDGSPRYSADLYVNTSLTSDWMPPKSAEESPILAGLEYIQIRRALRTIELENKVSSEKGPRILVVGGGSDPFEFVLKLYKILASLSIDFHATLMTVHSIPKINRDKFSIEPPGGGLENLLKDTDVIFSTSGTSSWEFIYLGIPLGIASAIENQNLNYRHQIKAGIATGIGSREVNTGWVFDIDAISDLILHPHKRKNKQFVVDGNGTFRLYAKILEMFTSNN